MTLRISSIALLPASWLLFACPVDSNDDIGDTDAATMTASSTMSSTATTTASTTAGDTSDSGSDTAPADVDYATDIQPIWNENCLTGCHETGGIYAALMLGEGTSYNALLEQKPVYSGDAHIVVPDSADSSLLIRGLRGTDSILRQMPLVLDTDDMGVMVGVEGPPLPEAQIALVEAWIDGGALE
jgi:hypothetical protein